MHDIWQTTLELRQPCLVRSPTPSMIGQDGIVRDKVYRAVDTTLLEALEIECAGAPTGDSFPHVTLANDKWLSTSALQKCVRRGHAELAVHYARSGLHIDADHTFRRLAIIALEDIGIGDLRLVATTLAVLGDKRRRRQMGEERLVSYLAERMSRAVKSRLACELLSLVEYDPSCHKMAEPLLGFDEEALRHEFLAEGKSLAKQLTVLWLLHGTDRFRSRQLTSVKGAGPRGLLGLMTRQRMPLLYHYIVKMGLSRSRDSLAIPYVLLASLFESDPLLETVKCQMADPQMIGSYPCFAFDMHTRVGRRAIREFEVNCTEWLQAEGIRDVGNWVFTIEGGRLNLALTGNWAEEISKNAWSLEVFGDSGRPQQVHQHSDQLLHHLNEFRRRAAVKA